MSVTSASAVSAEVVAVKPVFSGPERQALAGFLAGYTGLTREAYALDLRQFASWCQRRRPGTGDGHPPPVDDRRVLPVRGRGGSAGSFPGGPCPPPARGL